MNATDFQENKLSSICHIRRAKYFVSKQLRKLKISSGIQGNCYMAKTRIQQTIPMVLIPLNRII